MELPIGNAHAYGHFLVDCLGVIGVGGATLLSLFFLAYRD